MNPKIDGSLFELDLADKDDPWQDLGTFQLKAGEVSVILKGKSKGLLVADAVRFTLASMR